MATRIQLIKTLSLFSREFGVHVSRKKSDEVVRERGRRQQGCRDRSPALLPLFVFPIPISLPHIQESTVTVLVIRLHCLKAALFLCSPISYVASLWSTPFGFSFVFGPPSPPPPLTAHCTSLRRRDGRKQIHRLLSSTEGKGQREGEEAAHRAEW